MNILLAVLTVPAATQHSNLVERVDTWIISLDFPDGYWKWYRRENDGR